MIKKLLIANRGEIAVRVIRAAREMGIRTVAVYSEADANQMHVTLADEAIPLGAPEPAASYLDMAKIIEGAKRVGADAIHPGYGFLSERAEFAQACAEAGIVFIGPPASAMRKLGSKIEAKQLAVSVGVPVTPGFFEPRSTNDELRKAAQDIGFPVMLKASSGGGGRGMRVVREIEAFDDELSIASDEALKAFGNGEMMVEKLIEHPRHIEVQVLADAHGNVACLFERECSIQRRHQKLIEEAPSPVFCPPSTQHPTPNTSSPVFFPPHTQHPTPNTPVSEEWAQLRGAVTSLIQAAGYTGAGTVEFMYDEATRGFFFLEVNARLQVEHPVTEAITGLDLVQWQLQIASGERLDLSEALLAGDRAVISGHAIEARIVAEDPATNFMPSAGKIVGWAEPKLPGVRVDTGYGPGAEIPRYYDSLVAKLIAHGETREQAIAKLEAALLDFHILGIKTNIAYLLDVIRHPEFRAGKIDTGFLSREFAEWTPPVEIPQELFTIESHAIAGQTAQRSSAASLRAWDLKDGFRVARG